METKGKHRVDMVKMIALPKYDDRVQWMSFDISYIMFLHEMVPYQTERLTWCGVL